MGAVSLVFIAVLGLAFIILAIFLGMTLSANQKLASQTQYLPFTARIDSSTGRFTGFMRKDGSPQLSCPPGKKINIIGAFYDIFDPYGECSSDVTGVDKSVAYTCDPTVQSSFPCSDDSQCPGYIKGANNPFTCAIPQGGSTGFCQLAQLGSGADCPRGLVNVGGYCLDPNVCGVGNNPILAPNGQTWPSKVSSVGFPNPYCSPNNTSTKCAIRDASATVAAKCDGLQECPDLSIKDFGDSPCWGSKGWDMSIPSEGCLGTTPSGAIDFKQARVGYCGLPFAPGFGGGLPSSGTSSEPQTGNIGYTLHGIYTCVD